MNGNLCRCGTYVRIRQAIHKASEIATTSKLKKPSEVAVGQGVAQE
jgi:aerobic-type carbon monoxide dehydrogenase small subunit (CoxS/CutS family)